MTQAGSWDAACHRPATEQQCRDWSTANGRTMEAPHRVPGLPSACYVWTETWASSRSYFNTNPSGANNQGARRVCFEGGCPPAAPPPAPPSPPPPSPPPPLRPPSLPSDPCSGTGYSVVEGTACGDRIGGFPSEIVHDTPLCRCVVGFVRCQLHTRPDTCRYVSTCLSIARTL